MTSSLTFDEALNALVVDTALVASELVTENGANLTSIHNRLTLLEADYEELKANVSSMSVTSSSSGSLSVEFLGFTVAQEGIHHDACRTDYNDVSFICHYKDILQDWDNYQSMTPVRSWIGFAREDCDGFTDRAFDGYTLDTDGSIKITSCSWNMAYACCEYV